MPVINGCKYSCEPCIRGHRATSCAHTDRILIEVRKPGRPLESCGHEFATCTCGKITELLSMGTVLSTPASDQAGQSPNATLVATSPLLASVAAKSKERKQSRHRVRKNSRSKKGEASPMSTSNSRSSREYSTMLEDSRRETSFNQQSYAQDQMHPEGGPVPGSQQPTYGQYATPPYPTMQSPTQGPQTSGIYQTDQTFNNPYSYQMASSQQQQACHSVAYSSKIEDIARAPSAQQDDTDRDQPYVRSQYITARHESVWRETR